MILLSVILWLSVYMVFHSYVLYPVLLSLMTGSNKREAIFFEKEDLPFVSVIISMYNEEQVIEDKIRSVLTSEYPSGKFEILAGSDASDDRTNQIVGRLSAEFPAIRFYPFEQRQGKCNVVNRLVKEARGEILLLTDANVIFDKDTMRLLARHFKDSSIGLVDTNMTNTGEKKDGISVQEKAYISREVAIKNQESILWGTMMGPFGGCYAIRKELYVPVPSNFLVDDFYINMIILGRGKKAINEPQARVFEDVSNQMKEEFRRKIRIATGNFQNLRKFRSLLWPPFSGLAFSFMSHKVLRWYGPFFIILAFSANLALAFFSNFYFYLLLVQCFILLLPFIDFLLKRSGIHISFLRFISHFYLMNLSLLIGFFRFLGGVKSGIWQPTRRHQQ